MEEERAVSCVRCVFRMRERTATIAIVVAAVPVAVLVAGGLAR